MKILNGQDIADYIKARQLRQVRSFQNDKVVPSLVIFQVKDDPVIDKYVSLKQMYSDDIAANTELRRVDQKELLEAIQQANQDPAVHGIIVQLPISDMSNVEDILDSVAPEKDVDGLGKNSVFNPATPTAIHWLLSGYNVDFAGKHVVIVGRGRLVGQPLEVLVSDLAGSVTVIEEGTENIKETLLDADIIVSAAGVAGLITSEMIPQNAVVVDAGVSVEQGVSVGDLAQDVYERDDLVVSARIGGVGPLTICALYENVITAARNAIAHHQA